MAAGEVEIGMGIHNEPGSQRVRAELPALVQILLVQLLGMTDDDRAFLQITAEDDMVLLINNLGGVSMLEVGGITTEVVRQLKTDYGIKPVRILSGAYMTSLNALGFSITLLKTAETHLGPGKEILELLEAPAEAMGWSGGVSSKVWTEEWDNGDHLVLEDKGNFKRSTFRSKPQPFVLAYQHANCMP